MDASPETLTDRLWMVGALFETGMVLKRAQLRLAFPDVSEDEIERRLSEWLRDGPHGEPGDTDGRLVAWPRR